MIKSYHMLLSTIPRMRREESAVSAEEERLFVEIGHRLADALTSLLAYRDARESAHKLAQAGRVALPAALMEHGGKEQGVG